jgi:hypothetical protein
MTCSPVALVSTVVSSEKSDSEMCLLLTNGDRRSAMSLRLPPPTINQHNEHIYNNIELRIPISIVPDSQPADFSIIS